MFERAGESAAQRHPFVANAMLDCLARNGRLDEAETLFREHKGVDEPEPMKQRRENGSESATAERTAVVTNKEETAKWKRIVDEKSGRVFWWRADTEESQWEVPQGVLDHPTVLDKLLAGDMEKVKGVLVGAYCREDVAKEDFVFETTLHSDSKKGKDCGRGKSVSVAIQRAPADGVVIDHSE